MGRKSIPNWRQASSRISTRFSKRSKGRFDCGRPGSGAFRSLGRIQGRTSNIQHPISNTQRNGILRRRCGLSAIGWLERIEEKTSNLELRTSNLQRCLRQGAANPGFNVQRSMFNVQCSTFCPCPSRRVMGAWWPSRSSKPLSARSTGRGMFDSYPLRHFHLRFAIDDLRFEHTAQRASAAEPLVHRKSQIVNSKKGGGCRVTQTAP
jgi:hypothetical protein